MIDERLQSIGNEKTDLDITLQILDLDYDASDVVKNNNSNKAVQSAKTISLSTDSRPLRKTPALLENKPEVSNVQQETSSTEKGKIHEDFIGNNGFYKYV